MVQRWFVSALLAGALWSQIAVAAPGAPSASVNKYVLDSDDVVSVTFQRHPEFSVVGQKVGHNGTITVPGFGDFYATGKTTDQLKAAILKVARTRLLRPEVDVTLVQEGPHQVFVSGAVAKPGVYEIRAGWRISDAIIAAGGLTTRPENVDAALDQKNKPTQRLDVALILRDVDQPSNAVIADGDTLRVIEKTFQVTLAGQVNNPGLTIVPTGSGVVEAVARAGGVTAKAAMTKVVIMRGDQKVPVDLYKALVLGQKDANVPVQAGDLVTVPENRDGVTVSGEVNRPGTVPLTEGTPLTVSRAVANAGGVTSLAALSQAVLQRADGRLVPVDLYAILINGKLDGDLLLSPGDMLTIPQRSAKVTVTGAVQKPNVYDMPLGRPLRVSEAVTLAGGDVDRAALSRTVVTSASGKVTRVNLYKILIEGQAETDVVLQPGDLVTIPENHGITVLGAVQKPGTYYIDEQKNPQLSDVLALAGGLTVRPENVRLSILRTYEDGKQRLLKVDAVNLISLQDLSQNVRIQDGDLVNVSESKVRMVFISGQVVHPGGYELSEGEGVPELITKAGGETDNAALTKTNVVSTSGTSTVLDVSSAVRDGGPKPDFKLSDRDYVVVPENQTKTLILGAVNKPGSYPYPENHALSIGEAISMAGGPSAGARLKDISIFRQTPQGVQRREISLEKSNHNQLATNEVLQPGDLVYIPEKKQSISVLALLGVASTLGTTLRK